MRKHVFTLPKHTYHTHILDSTWTPASPSGSHMPRTLELHAPHAHAHTRAHTRARAHTHAHEHARAHTRTHMHRKIGQNEMSWALKGLNGFQYKS